MNSNPPELEDFVSTAQDLLGQFKRIEIQDHVCCQFYLNEGILVDFIALREFVVKKVQKLTSNYIWHSDEISFTIVSSNTEDIKSRFFLQGLNFFGDNIEDEWFIVYILLEISLERPDVSICVTDADGQFLLIEAAEHIPSWLGPHNSARRVWIRNGNIHILSIEEGSVTSDGGIKLQAALDLLDRHQLSSSTQQRNSIADRSVQRVIKTRIAHYPHQADASMFRFVCTLPREVALLLLHEPQLIAKAATAFCNADKSELTKVSSHGKRFNSNSNHLVTLSVLISRALYAQMSFKSFHPPPRFHSAIRDSSLSTTSCAPGVARAVAKALDLGCRICVGMEIAYNRSMVESKKPHHKIPNGCMDDSLKRLKALGVDLSDETVLNQVQELLTTKALWLDTSSQRRKEESGGSVHPPPSHPPKTDIPLYVHINELLSTNNRGNATELLSSRVISDYKATYEEDKCANDDWLYMSLEELDAEMEATVRRLRGQQTSSPSSSSVPPSESLSEGLEQFPVVMVPGERAKTDSKSKSGDNDDDNDGMQVQVMVEGMRKFMLTSSEVSGVVDSSDKWNILSENDNDDDSDSDDEDECEDDNVDGNEDGDPCEGLCVDMERLLDIIAKAEETGKECVSDDGTKKLSSLLLSTKECVEEKVSKESKSCQSLPVVEPVAVTVTAVAKETGDIVMESMSGTGSRLLARQQQSKAMAMAMAVASTGECHSVDSDDEDEAAAAGDQDWDRDSFYDSSQGSVDSDDDMSATVANGDGDPDGLVEEEYLSQYMAAMDEELLSEPILAQSFELNTSRNTFRNNRNNNPSNTIEDPLSLSKKDCKKESGEDDPFVDVDLNFLKYMLESHASQTGPAGPASNFMSQLGISMPHHLPETTCTPNTPHPIPSHPT
eukprot:gene334-600_t